ncbi:hypothetical protein [Shewanella litorisediminis]|uniref:Leucine Rich repeats (2 copies) n=1 Tax=Shewanella litorisediminis TaxID=1173586 RepID=A0ABX7G5E8_9GAMM|nr:hypothetical protein [Shewanella litorisediminis]MCL2918033.1 hypothetical protein [Shewanella litorisediminis]QRH02463.1 hypothetical protein JQC75_03285 [Shewanella litorisediminis]
MLKRAFFHAHISQTHYPRQASSLPAVSYALMGLIALSALAVHPALAADRDSLIAEFEAQTKPLLRKGRTKSHGWDDEAFRNGLERHNGDARALLGEGWPARFLADAKGQRLLAGQYRAALAKLIGDMPAKSHCKDPAPLARVDEALEETDAYIERLKGYGAIADQGAAYQAVMDMSISHGRVLSVMELGETFRTCVLADDVPAMSQGLSGDNGNALAMALMAALAGEDADADLDTDTTLNEDLSGMHESQSGEAASAEMDSIRHDSQHGDSQHGDSQHGDSQHDYSQQDEAQPPASRPISTLQFTDPVIGECIKAAAKRFGVSLTNELELLSCPLKGASVSLDDLHFFSQLGTLSLENGSITHISTGLPLQLHSLLLSEVQLQSFAGLSAVKMLQLSQVSVADWSAIGALKNATLQLERIDCTGLQSQVDAGAVVVISRGLSPTLQAEKFALAERTGTPLAITDCPAG